MLAQEDQDKKELHEEDNQHIEETKADSPRERMSGNMEKKNKSPGMLKRDNLVEVSNTSKGENGNTTRSKGVVTRKIKHKGRKS